MNKKIWVLLGICLVIICIVTILIFNEKDNLAKNKEGVIKNKAYLIHSGYIGELSDNNKIIINNTTDKEQFLQKYDLNLKKYDEKFFDNNSLAIVYVELVSGSQKIKNLNAETDKDNLNIYYKVLTPEMGTADMNGYIILVEIDKNISNINIENI